MIKFIMLFVQMMMVISFIMFMMYLILTTFTQAVENVRENRITSQTR